MTNWNDLPYEIRQFIVKHCTHETRVALGSCSSGDRELISSASLITAPLLIIGYSSVQFFDFHPSWYISFPNYGRLNYETFEEMQQRLKVLLKSFHFFDFISIKTVEASNFSQNLNLTTDQQKLKVEHISISTKTGDELMGILKQIEPTFLKKLTLNSDEASDSTYDMQHVVMAEEVYFNFSKNSIREDQLLKLNARIVEIENLSFPASNYIKKCLLEANTKFVQFRFSYSDEKFLRYSFAGIETTGVDMTAKPMKLFVKTPYDDLKLELSIVTDRANRLNLKGSITSDSERFLSLHFARDPSMLRTIRSLSVRFADEDRNYKIEINRRWHIKSYRFNSIAETQQKLDEILENTDYIKKLDVDTRGGRDIKFKPREKPLTVGEIDVVGSLDEVLPDLLKIVEPVHLKNLSVIDKIDDKEIFSMPQVRHAVSLLIYDALRDDQLLQLDAISLVIYDNTGFFEPDLTRFTAAGLNKFMKKCLVNLNEKNYNFTFEIFGIRRKMDENELFKDLHCVSSNWNAENSEKTTVINSDHPKFVLAVIMSDNKFCGSRKLRSDDS